MLNTYTAYLSHILTPARFQHSLGVMQVMGELAQVYGLERDTARMAGLLHDAAKDFTPGQQEQIIREGNILVVHPCERDYNLYLHGPVSAYSIQKELGVTDPLVVDAVYTHTWCDGDGEHFHHPLAWCLRFADILEPYRKWDGKARIIGESAPQRRELVYSGRLTEAALYQADMIIRFFDENGFPIHPNYYRVLSSSYLPGSQEK